MSTRNPKKHNRLRDKYLGENEDIIVRNGFINQKDWYLLEELYGDTNGFRSYITGAILHKICEGLRNEGINTYEQFANHRFRDVGSLIAASDPFRDSAGANVGQ